MSDLLVAELILDDRVAVFYFSWDLLLDDVAFEV